MNLLFLTPQLPFPPYQGASLRNYNIIRGLAEVHEISLLSYTRPGGEQDIAPELLALCEEVIAIAEPPRSTYKRLWQMTARGEPDMALRLQSPSFAQALQRVLAQKTFAIVQIEGIELAWTIPLIRRASPQSRIVYDAHNAETLLQARAGAADRRDPRRWPAAAYSWVQSRRLRPYEQWACRAVDWITAVSEADRSALLSLTPEAGITLIPNCIDVVARSRIAAEAASGEANNLAFDVVFSGKMDYRPNVDAVLWFADQVWPHVLGQYPRATWAIVGQKPHSRLDRLRNEASITITGWVPDVVPYIVGGKVFIMPFRVGSGTRLKLIEALAAGRAVVSTTVGVEGFPVRDLQQLLIADSEAEFTKAIVQLLEDPRLRDWLGKRGQEFANQYDWRTVTPLFQPVYEHLVPGPDVTA